MRPHIPSKYVAAYLFMASLVYRPEPIDVQNNIDSHTRIYIIHTHTHMAGRWHELDCSGFWYHLIRMQQTKHVPSIN